MGSRRRSQFYQGVLIQYLEVLVEEFGKLLKCSGIECVLKINRMDIMLEQSILCVIDNFYTIYYQLLLGTH